MLCIIVLSVSSMTRLPGAESGRSQSHVYVPHQVSLLQMATRDVEGDVQARAANHLVTPAPPVLAGPLQHEPAELDDEPRLLGQVDEMLGHQHAALGVPPACERLDTEQVACAELDDWLVFEEELAVGERAFDVSLETQALAKRLLHLWLRT